MTRAEAHLVKTKYSQCLNETNGALMVHLWPVGRPYGSSTACWKAVRFTLQTVSRTYGQLGAPFGRQPRRYLGRDFLRISFMFYGFIFMYFFCVLWFYQSKLWRLYTSGSIFQVLPVYNYSNYCTEEFPMYFCVLWFYFLCISFVFYGSIEAITEAIHRWFHFSSTASVWLQHLLYHAYLRVQYTKYVFTHSVHQPPAYASGAPLKHWLIRGEGRISI